MHWLYLLLAVGFLFGASRVAGWLVVVLLIASLALFLAWMYGWVTSRISSGARTDAQILSAEELRVMREQAAARKTPGPSGPSDAQS
jgi:hypothetical protein